MNTQSFPQRAFTRRAGLVVSAILAVILLTGCTGGGPGSKAEFVEVLTRGDGFNEAEAGCIADAVFSNYEDDDSALKKISAAEDYEELTKSEGDEGYKENKAVEGFNAFFSATVQGCADSN